MAPAAEAVTPLDSATAVSYERFHLGPVADRPRATMLTVRHATGDPNDRQAWSPVFGLSGGC